MATQAEATGVALREARAVLERCDKENPKAEDVLALRRYLQNCPDLWREYGDMAGLAEAAVIMSLPTPDTPARIQCAMAGLRTRKVELGYESATPLEKMLIRHVLLCELRLQAVEMRYYSVLKGGTVSIREADYWERRLSAAQGRLLRACTTLARIRKMRLPALQVNIAADGAQQVNVQGSVRRERLGPGRKR